MKVGDIVLISDSNPIRGEWKMARVSKAYLSQDGFVRKVDVQYKSFPPQEHAMDYRGSAYITVERPVQRLIVLVSSSESSDNNDDNRVASVGARECNSAMPTYVSAGESPLSMSSHEQ